VSGKGYRVRMDDTSDVLVESPSAHGSPAHHHPFVKPLLRGWSHVVALFAVVVLGIILIVRAADTARGAGVMVVYVAGTSAMFGVSAAYHRLRWNPRSRTVMSKLDHSTIFLAIAGAYTPVAVVGLHGVHRIVVLSISWIGAVIGISLQWLPFHLPRWLFAAVYVLVGWSAMFAFPQLYDGLGATGFFLILGGGLAYTAGALIYALKRPDPWPMVFGFHEVFHVFTIIGAGLHFGAIAFSVLPLM
jgi:hemolysin III